MKRALSGLETSKSELLNQLVALQEDNALVFKLMTGSKLTKYTSKAGKKHERHFKISPDLQFLQWHIADSSRKLRQQPLDNIEQIVLGNSKFSCNKQSVSIKEDPKKCCFSIILQSRNLHIVCINEDQRDMWIRGLSVLTDKNRQTELYRTEREFNMSLEDVIRRIEKKDDKIAKYKKFAKESHARAQELEKEKLHLQEQLSETNKILDDFNSSNKNLAHELSQKNATLKEQEDSFVSIRSKHAEQNSVLLTLKSKLNAKEKEFINITHEFSEFKRQIKESFSAQLIEKVSTYRKSKEVMCAYADELKVHNQTLEKEVSLWQSVVFHYALPTFQAKRIGSVCTLKEVLNFALDSLEQKFNIQRTNKEFANVLTNSRTKN